jgi:thiosulfate dehydrogenase [quinone] large subunit
VKKGARRSFDRTKAVTPPRAYSTNSLPPAGQPSSGRVSWDNLRRLPVAAVALLPLRVFFGITFLYAGLDKILDPDFFNAASASSIQAQFLIYERVSPLGSLVHLAEPVAPLLGALVALGEIAVGIGALTGLAFRLAALGGALTSALFFLTASWATHPYYFGNDLPYAFGWLTLALAGHGDLLVMSLSRSGAQVQAASADPRRRVVLQVGALAAVTLFVGGVAGAIRLIRNEPPRGTDTGDIRGPGSGSTPGPTGSGSPGASPAPSAEGSPTSGTGSGIAIATVAQVQSAGARRFTVPITAPAPLPAGDPALVIALSGGSFAAYDALCTHEGCRVSYDKTAGVIFCPCHGAEFDPANHAAVLGGPAPQPLLELPLIVNQADGTIALAIS